MIEELEGLGRLGEELCEEARRRSVRLFWRAQLRSIHSVAVQDGKTESSSRVTAGGHGVHVVTADGRSALASRDDFVPDAARDLLARAVEIADGGASLGATRAVVPDLPRTRGVAVPELVPAYDRIDLADTARRLTELEQEIRAGEDDVQIRVGFRADLDGWRILREDGSDVRFVIPRTVVSVRAAHRRAGRSHSASASAFSPSCRALGCGDFVTLLTKRARRAVELVRRLPDAPAHPSGSFPLVIDYALAKGLAHEAFGHASEADGFRSSVLARDGRFRTGTRVGADHVSIVDEPVADDHAWQPFSANGLTRDPVRIVDRGRLSEALADPWSAEAGGVPLRGSARAESYRSAPLPRMTNIRIEVDGAGPAPGDFEDYDPERVRSLLAEAGVFRRHREIRYLSGYSGGQVNTTSGEFVFNCKAIYVLDESSIRLHKPAIFSGSMFGALESVREAFGPLRLDALGYCGKWGQSVPSSGGSHYFLVLDAHPEVKLGGGA